jgi:AcrR family transcriptional regulator
MVASLSRASDSHWESAAMSAQVPEAPRKRPTQQRARDTVAAILVAAAHILETEGPERATTNRIAELAGVSIGSLYQYFPNKHAVVAALRERHSEWFDETLREEAARELLRHSIAGRFSVEERPQVLDRAKAHRNAGFVRGTPEVRK